MKAAIFDPANQAKDGDRSVLEVHDINVRDPQPGEVLVRTTTSGVCHSDLHFVDGKWAAAFGGLPAVLGHEAAGVVETVGDDVTYVQPGDNVIMSFRPYCGDCYWCLRGEPNLCPDPAGAALARDRLNWDGRPVVQMASVGSFGEYMLTTQSGVLKIPEDIPPAEAALVGCGVMTGVGAALYTAKVPGGSVVAVIGCGGVGLNVIQGCKIAGASRIIAVDILDNKLDFAEQFGATDRINASEVDAVEAVQELTQGMGVEIAFEAIGNVHAARQAWDMVRAGGTACIVGMMPLGSEVALPGPEFLQEKKAIGCMYGSTRFREHMPKLLDLYRQGKLDLSGLVSKRFALGEINEAFAAMQAGEVARGVLDISQP
ncbi:MAG: Zn-dependent alcohol dehydrogenase [Chloroflexi bacterium]|nr:Zn-dependent alcohol dehydrogenase [Chloroflexota bacterium]MYD17203.1 Zn-dependent alcohol dehydrogenase [Chloroflexota bacterium]MYJ00863.1 Zn-dependent alcohol dehydrogenase [Chloroflexota bacterium]